MAERRVAVLQRFSRRMVIASLAALAILVICPIAVWLSERNHHSDVDSLGAGYQWLVRTLFEGSTAYHLNAGPSYLVYYIVDVAGVSLVAFVTGAVASKLVTAVMMKGKGMGSTKASGHIVICGWSSKGPEIVRELRAKEVEDRRPIVVLAPVEDDPTRDDSVEFLKGDPADTVDLHRANILGCSTAIILADESNPTASAGDKDARTLLTCLAVESIAPDVYSCVEVVRSENRQHFERTRVNEMVVSAELTGALLAGSARTHGLSKLVGDLVTHPEGQEFYRMRPPPDLVGVTMSAALSEVKDRFDALLVGFVNAEGAFDLNPAGTRPITADDVMLVISSNADALAALAEG